MGMAWKYQKPSTFKEYISVSVSNSVNDFYKIFQFCILSLIISFASKLILVMYTKTYFCHFGGKQNEQKA